MARGSDPHYFRNHRRGIAVWALVAAFGFGGLGLWHIRTWAWATTTGQLSQCEVRMVGSGSNAHGIQDCDVAWVDGSAKHSDRVTFDGGDNRSGTSAKISVQGDAAYAFEERGNDLLLALAGAGFLVISIGFMVWRPKPLPPTA